MHIAWVTPRPSRSAIGRDSVATVAALQARGHAVSVIGSEAAELADEPQHAFSGASRLRSSSVNRNVRYNVQSGMPGAISKR